MAEDQPEEPQRMFKNEDIPEIVKLFDKPGALRGRDLKEKEFCDAMKKIYGDSVSEEELIVLHMKIDANFVTTVDLDGLMTYLLNKNIATQNLDYKKQLFSHPFENVKTDCHQPIIYLFFHPLGDVMDPECDLDFSVGQLRPYQNGQYISITPNGMMTSWTDMFEKISSFPLHKKDDVQCHRRKIQVHDIVHIRELKQLALATSAKDLVFYKYKDFLQTPTISHALIVDGDTVNAMHYWSNGTKAVFSFGDIGGYLTVFISYNVKEKGLFLREAYKQSPQETYPSVYVSVLLKRTSKDFLCFIVPIFDDFCNQVRYCPSLDSFAICRSSTKTMVLAAIQKSSDTKVSKTVFESSGTYGFFRCVDYSASAERLLTGGRDGILRVWRPHRTTCEKTLRGHAKPITHIRVNRKERIFVSLSDDKNVRVWSENAWVCLQSLHVHHMGKCPVSSMCYNVYNNELVLANTGIAKCLGRGTEVFESAITSHDKPLCGVLYHDVFKQILSAGENGVVTVWDILTGKAVIEFKVTPNEHVMVTAMAFDYPQRRLITASYDRKLRVWNFNSGAELGVFPVTMQNEVTGIVCINNSVFVCERNSNIIYDLDINGHDNKYLEYDYLNDIFSMDGHSTTLVASSVNGNIAVWNVETSKVIFWLNTSVSPQVHMAPKEHQGRTGFLHGDHSHKKESDSIAGHVCETTADLTNTEVEISLLVICLKTREVNVNTATLLTSANGYIYAWSVISEGGLLGKFREMENEGTFITTMSTDAKEQILLTGDNTGMIFLWDIQGFGYKTEDDKGPFEDINGWCVSLCPPPLLRSWQCHLSGVVSVLCDPPCKNVITGGLDCNLQLWTNTGISIGLFGKDEWDDKIRNSQTQPSESLESLSPNSQIQNVDDLSAKPEEAVSPPEGVAEPDAKSELDSKPETEEEPELDSKLETEEESELDSNSDTEEESELDSKPEQGTKPESELKSEPEAKLDPEWDLSKLSDAQFFALCRKLIMPKPSLDKKKDKNGQTGRSRQDLPHRPCLKHDQSSSGTLSQISTLQDEALPCPPDTKPDKKGTSHQLRLPPISDRVDETDHQAQLKSRPVKSSILKKPHRRHTPFIKGMTRKRPKFTLSHVKRFLKMPPNQTDLASQVDSTV